MSGIYGAALAPAYEFPKLKLKIPATLERALGCAECDAGSLGPGKYCECTAGQNLRAHEKRVKELDSGRRERAERVVRQRIEAMLGQLPETFTAEETMLLAESMRGQDGKKEAVDITLEMLRDGIVDGRKGILYMGNFGVGKTTLMYLLARTYIDRGLTVTYVDFDDWTRKVQASYGQSERRDLVSPLMGADVVFVDNLGTDPDDPSITGDQLAMLNRVLEARNKGEKKPTFIASNLDKVRLQIMLREHCYNRFLELCNFVTVSGENFRPQQ